MRDRPFSLIHHQSFPGDARLAPRERVKTFDLRLIGITGSYVTDAPLGTPSDPGVSTRVC